MYMFYKDLTGLRDYALLVLRLAVAAIFLYHGIGKWVFFQESAEGMSQGFVTLMQVLAVAEPLAGISLVLGLFMQVGNLGLILVMIGALYLKIVMSGQGSNFSVWEIDLILLASNIALLILGSGRFSMDFRMRKR